MSEEEILEKMARQMATAKKWATENDEVKQTKACLGELRTLVTDYKKENNKKEAQAKKLAKKKDGKAADKGDGHLVRPDTLDCVAWMAREMRKNEKMANSHVSYSSAVIGRDQVNKQVIRWLWKSVPEIAEERLAVPSEQQLKDIWQAQFGQVCPGKGSVCLGTGFSLPELTVLLEGSDLFLHGFPFEKPVSLEDMKGLTAKEYLDKCTWHVHLKVGHGLLLPPNHVFMVLNPG
ncbi:unnamed protein product, partial [Symbiodinium pilosum]